MTANALQGPAADVLYAMSTCSCHQRLPFKDEIIQNETTVRQFIFFHCTSLRDEIQLLRKFVASVERR